MHGSYSNGQELPRKSKITFPSAAFASHTSQSNAEKNSSHMKSAETWRFEHKNSSPCYPQSNGKAENAVKVYKALLKKVRGDKKDPLLAFLDWRNTPSKDLGTTPVHRLMGRRTRTLLPTHTKLLEPKVDSQTGDKLAKRKSHLIAAIQHEKSTTSTVTARSTDQDETLW